MAVQVQIINNGASLEIITSGKSRDLMKSQIHEVSVLRGTIIKIDRGMGALYNVFIDQSLVNTPPSSSPDDLKNQILAMLQPSTQGQGQTMVGYSTEMNQILELSNLANMQNQISDLQNKMGSVDSKMGSVDNRIANVDGKIAIVDMRIQSVDSRLGSLDNKLFFQPAITDQANPNMIYKGYALPGSATRDPVWAIEQVSFKDDLLVSKWASGNKFFDKIWDNRANMDYI